MEKTLYTPTTGGAVKLLLLNLFIGVILIMVFEWIFPVLGLDSKSPWANTIISVLSMALLLYWLQRKYRLQLYGLLDLQKFRPAILAPVITTAIGAIIVASEIANYMLLIFPLPEFILEIFSMFDTSKYGHVGVFIATAIVAPVIEEILYRGLILRGLLSHYSPRKAILISALIFAISHANPWQFPIALILGILLGWWFYRTKSLIPCIAAHIFNNALIVLLDLTPLDITGFTSERDTLAFQPIWFTLMGAAIFIGGVLWCKWWFRQTNLLMSPEETAIS